LISRLIGVYLKKLVHRVIYLLNDYFLKLGVKVPEVLLPNSEVDLYKWAVVACDQYTSEPDYWREVARLVGEAPSTLNLVFPEVYLGKGSETERINRIHQNMIQYLKDEILHSCGAGFIYLERRTSHAPCRKGLIMAFDLECYDYYSGSKSLIRATEGTVLERLPPRVKIREGALLEMPHIMILIDDPDCRVIEPLALQTGDFKCLYETGLMMNGGYIRGFLVREEAVLEKIHQGLADLAEPNRFNQKYGVHDEPVFLFAVGDGNHSLATAKAVWEKIKAKPGIDPINHPARYALAEVVNIHDPGLQFEPIHRLLFNVTSGELFEAMKSFFGAEQFALESFANRQAMDERLKNAYKDKSRRRIGFVNEEGYGVLTITDPQFDLEVDALQSFLDKWLSEHSETEIDYIHGAEAVQKIGSQHGNIGFFLPALAKNLLFKTVIRDGALPRKSFSMGEAEEKRFYLECRRIR
jgi:hypothetical protein